MRLYKMNENRRHCFRPSPLLFALYEEPPTRCQVRCLSVTRLQAGPALFLLACLLWPGAAMGSLPTPGLPLWCRILQILGLGFSLTACCSPLLASLSSSESLLPFTSAENDHFLKESISLEKI